MEEETVQSLLSELDGGRELHITCLTGRDRGVAKETPPLPSTPAESTLTGAQFSLLQSPVHIALVTALLCLISVCVSEFHTVELQPAEQVTLMCSNFSSFTGHMFWFRLDSRPNISRISSMWSSDSNASLYDGFQNGKFNMTSNTTTLFLNITHVDLADSGLYFCGFYSDGKPVIVTATYLKVQEVFDGITSLTSVILLGLILFLVPVVIGLIVKIRKFHTEQYDQMEI
ncbi:uncharacterized protein LOC120573543 [Perca fluviatilis]|uniref:uncharacterized protein LOC120573543 n=1 Tax=Perca fluviatilis TaxID=8168 RepID=UPI001965BBE8|nr:uncharacterized protein LOC120573543 [Perca fluviatilis]